MKVKSKNLPKPKSLTALVKACVDNEGMMQLIPSGQEPVCGYILLEKLPCEYQGEKTIMANLTCYNCNYKKK